MKKIILAIITTLTLTGCLQNTEETKSFYDEQTIAYLNKSIAFNNNYKSHLTTEQALVVSESKKYSWENIVHYLPYLHQDTDIFYCPEYTLNADGADCDMFAYLSTRFETRPFVSFVLIKDLTDSTGHMIALYSQANKFLIYNNQYKISYTTLSEYLATEYPASHHLYIAYISEDLKLTRSELK